MTRGQEKLSLQRVVAIAAAATGVVGALLGPVAYSVRQTERVSERVDVLAVELERHQQCPDAPTERRLAELERTMKEMSQRLTKVAEDVCYLRGLAEREWPQEAEGGRRR